MVHVLLQIWVSKFFLKQKIFFTFSSENNFFPPFFSRGSCALDKQVYNNSWKLEQTIPDYYNGQVLLRSSPTYPQSFSGELRFQTLFHIVVIWMSVFIGLSKGLKSYGKVVYLFAICPLVGYIVFTIKVIGLLPLETFQYWIKSTNWLNFFYNGDVSNIFSHSFSNFLNFYQKN